MINLQVRTKTDLTAEPVSNTEAKLWCKVSGSTEDSIFTILVAAARKALEKYTASSFGEKTLYATWITMPEDNLLELPYGPIISVDAVYKIDEEGTEELLTLDSDYYVYGDQDVNISVQTIWSTGIKSERSIRVEYTAGYGHVDTETLPTDLKLAILKQVATDYMFRENLSETQTTNLSNDAKSLAAPYRKKLWF